MTQSLYSNFFNLLLLVSKSLIVEFYYFWQNVPSQESEWPCICARVYRFCLFLRF